MGYQIKVDGSLLYASDADESHVALNPKLTLDVNKAGSLTFTLPPGNVKHRQLQKLKNIITVDHDGERLFRGRVLEVETDMYNQQSVYCEGGKAFLLDSLIAPYTYSGTVHGLFTKLIDNHNAKVDDPKKFAVGTINVVPGDKTVEVENTCYADTMSEIESRLLGAYGGYLRERQEGTVRYLDWVKEYGSTNEQPIEFAVNLLDLKEKVSAEEVFTVLIPLGAMQIDGKGNRTEPLTVASVNGGNAYIEDADGVAMYGRIERCYTWDHVETAAELLEKGKEYLKTGVALQTLRIKAVDMHFVDPATKSIRVGDKVRILSEPNGIDIIMMCSKVTIDLENPENTEYTFGEKPRTLTDNVVNTQEEVNTVTGGGGGGGGRGNIVEQTEAILRWAAVNVEETKGRVQLVAVDINKLTGKMSSVEITLNAVTNEIKALAKKEYVDEIEERVTSAEVRIADDAVAIKANKTAVDKLTGRVDTAESTLSVQAGQISTKVSQNGVISAINQTAETITIQASKINLSGYVTASQLNSTVANIWASTITLINASTVTTETLNTTYCNTAALRFNSTTISKRSMTVSTPSGDKTIYYLGYVG